MNNLMLVSQLVPLLKSIERQRGQNNCTWNISMLNSHSPPRVVYEERFSRMGDSILGVGDFVLLTLRNKSSYLSQFITILDTLPVLIDRNLKVISTLIMWFEWMQYSKYNLVIILPKVVRIR